MWRSGVLSVLLLVSLVLSALSAVTAQHQARKSFIVLQQEKERARQIEVEWGQLQLEQSTLAASARVENIASEQLKMLLPAHVRFIQIEPSSFNDRMSVQRP